MAERTTETPVLDLLTTMTTASLETSTLDPETLILVRIAALVAVDAPPASYMLNLGAAGDVGRRSRRLDVRRGPRTAARGMLVPAHGEREAWCGLVGKLPSEHAGHGGPRRGIGERGRERVRAGELVVALGLGDPGRIDRLGARERRLGADPHLDPTARDQLVVGREAGIELVVHAPPSGCAQSSARGIGAPASSARLNTRCR